MMQDLQDQAIRQHCKALRMPTIGGQFARLAEAAALWAPRLAHLPRPLVSVLVGGSNGRFRLGAAEAAALGAQLADMMHRDHVGLALTPSRRTSPAACAAAANGWPTSCRRSVS